MAIQDNPYKAALIGLYQEMETAPMSIQDYAEKLAHITDTQILTTEVSAGIELQAGPYSGATSAKGKVE
jgi:hypothetical protein